MIWAEDFNYDVFLSYCSRDKPVVRDLAERLRNDGLRVWFDDWRIRAGERIDAKIETGLETSRCVVLVMSPHAFESDWVGLERGTALFRDPANTQRRFIPLLIDDCQIPDILKPYKHIDYRDKGHAAYQQLLTACQPETSEPDTQAPLPQKPGLDGRFELTVQLIVDNDQLVRRYFARQRFIHDYGSSWSPLEDTLSLWRTDPDLCHGNVTFHQRLFQVLFGPPDGDRVLTVLRQVCGPDIQTPIYHPIRLRLHTQDDVLAELPWPLTCWQQEPLVRHGWTFECVADAPEDSRRPYKVDFQAPFPILLMAPTDASDQLGWHMHQRDVEQKLRDVWPVTVGFVHHAGDATAIDAIRQRLGPPPRLVYYYGPGRVQDGKLCLHLQTSEQTPSWIPADTLMQRLGNRGVTVVFLNLIQDEPLPLGTTLAELSRQVPLVISQHVGRKHARDAQSTFIAWLYELLNGEEPLPALHGKGHPSAVAWRHYDSWHLEVRGRDGIPMERLGHLLLDRTEERALVNHAVDQLIDHDQRLTCVIAYAEAGNHIEMFFSEQARDYLMRHARDKVSVQLLSVPLLLDPLLQETAFETAVRRAFTITDDDLPKGLSRALERVRQTLFAGRLRGNARPLLLLDWQVWRTEPSSPIEPGLRAWVRFNREQLCQACPKNLHLLSCLALEGDANQHDTIKHVVESLRLDRETGMNRTFSLEKPAYLHHVSYDELVDFFMQHQDDLNCPSRDVGFDLAAAIYRQTHGQYDAILRLLDARRTASWETLLGRWQTDGDR